MKSGKSGKRIPSVSNRKKVLLTPIRTLTNGYLLDFKSTAKSPMFPSTSKGARRSSSKTPSVKKRSSTTKRSIDRLSEMMGNSSKTPVKKVKISCDHDLKSILKKTPLKSNVSVTAARPTRSVSRNIYR